MVDWTTISISVIGGLGGAIIGATFAPYFTYILSIKQIKEKIYFEKKLNYAENISETLDKKNKKYVDFYNLLHKIKYPEKKSIQNLVALDNLTEESKLFKNMSNLYFDNFIFAKECLNYLETEKNLQEIIKEIGESKNEDTFNSRITTIRSLLDSMLSQAQDITNAFNKELKQ